MNGLNITPPADFITLPPRTLPANFDGFIAKHKTPTLLKCHGIIMSFTWIVLASTGILIARYYKNAWPNKTLCGKPVWFQCHRIIFGLVFVLTLLGICVAYAYEGPFSDAAEVYTTFQTVHPPCGVTVFVLVIVNPLLAMLRPAADSPRRKYFYFVHFVLGVCAWILANVNIYVAFGHPTGLNSVAYEVMNDLLYAWWGFLIFSIILFEGHRWMVVNRCNQDEKKLLKEKGYFDEPHNLKTAFVANNGATFLKSYLCIYVSVTVICSFAFSLCLAYHGI